MKKYDYLKEQAYAFGNHMVKCKETYHACLEERERLINRSSVCDKMAKDYARKAQDLSELQKGISDSLTQENKLKAEGEGLKGSFKNKGRKECQNRLEQQKKESQRPLDRVKTDHNTTPESIPQKLKEYSNQKDNFIKEKAKVMAKTDEIEKIKEKSLYSYKYHKAVSDCQSKEFKEISNGLNTREKLFPGEENFFYTTKKDRTQILKDMKTNQSLKEKCKEVWKNQDSVEQQELNKQLSNQSRNLEPER